MRVKVVRTWFGKFEGQYGEGQAGEDGWFDVLLDNYPHLGPVPFHAREVEVLTKDD